MPSLPESLTAQQADGAPTYTEEAGDFYGSGAVAKDTLNLGQIHGDSVEKEKDESWDNLCYLLQLVHRDDPHLLLLNEPTMNPSGDGNTWFSREGVVTWKRNTREYKLSLAPWANSSQRSATTTVLRL